MPTPAALLAVATLAGGDCPPGTSAHVASTAGGRVMWCARPDGAWHGPMLRWYPDGRPAASGNYRDGESDGAWTLYHPNGRISQSGLMASGRPDGRWTTWTRKGDPLGEIEYEGLELEDLAAASTPDDPRFAWELPVTGAVLSLLAAGPEAVVVTTAGVGAIDLALGGWSWWVEEEGAPAPWVDLAGDRVAWVTFRGLVREASPSEGWVRTIDARRPLAGMVGAWDDVVVVLGQDGRLAAFDPETGRRLWQGSNEVTILRPAVTDSRVLVVSGSEVRAFDPRSGRVRWRARAGGAVAALESTEDGRFLALSENGWLSCFEAEGGALAWRRRVQHPSGAVTSLRAEGGDVVVVTDRLVQAFDEDGHPAGAWELPAGSAPDVFGDSACSVAGRTLTCARRPSAGGAPLAEWSLGVPSPASTLLVAGDLVLVAGQDGRVRAADAPAARVLWQTASDRVRDGADEVAVSLVPAQGEPVAVEVPLREVERRTAEGCRRTTAILDLSAVGEEIGPAEVVIDSIERAWSTGEGEPEFHPAWEAALLASAREIEYRYRWEPRVTGAWPRPATAAALAELDRLLKCSIPAASFLGTVEVTTATVPIVRRRFDGMLRIDAQGEVVDGEPGCLLSISLGGETLGAWSAPAVAGWMPLAVRAWGTSGDLPAGVTALPAFASGGIDVETTLPGAPGPSVTEIDGPTAVETSADGFRVLRDGTVVFELSTPDLRYAETGPDEVPTVHHTEEWELSGRALPPPGQPFVELWSSESCPSP